MGGLVGVPAWRGGCRWDTVIRLCPSLCLQALQPQFRLCVLLKVLNNPLFSKCRILLFSRHRTKKTKQEAGVSPEAGVRMCPLLWGDSRLHRSCANLAQFRIALYEMYDCIFPVYNFIYCAFLSRGLDLQDMDLQDI